MKIKYLYWIVPILVAVALFVGYRAWAIVEPLECEEGYKAEEVLVEEAIPAIPEYTECVWAGLFQGEYSNSICTNKKGAKHWNKVVHPEVPEVPAVYEWQCVVDEDYVPDNENGNGDCNGTTPEPVKPIVLPRSGDSGMYGRVQFLLKGSPEQVALANQLMKQWHWLFPTQEARITSIRQQIKELQDKINELLEEIKNR
jgi:hypothetical protein